MGNSGNSEMKFYLEVTLPFIEVCLANAVVLSIATRGFVILNGSWELRVTGSFVIFGNWE